jgi:hypothetical protein
LEVSRRGGLINPKNHNKTLFSKSTTEQNWSSTSMMQNLRIMFLQVLVVFFIA